MLLCVVNLMNNVAFCYWLQGYFEIAKTPVLNVSQVQCIENRLIEIVDPLGDGPFIAWLREVVSFIKHCDYDSSIINHLQPVIMRELAYLFKHDIDNSYATTISPEDLYKIHNGTMKLEDLT